MKRFTAVAALGGCLFIAACASVIGFPDRTLDDSIDGATASDGGATDDATGMVGVDATPDTSIVDAGPAHATFSTTGIDFGLVPCGAAVPAPKVITITNSGGAPLTWSASFATTADFAISGAAAGTIAPGAFATVTIEATAVPALSGAGDTAQSVVTITTSDVQNPMTAIPIKRTAAGGTLSVVPLTADFGDTPATVAAQPIPIAFKNTGNQAVMIGFGTPSGAGADAGVDAGTDGGASDGFTLAWTGSPAAVSVAPGAVVPALVANFLPMTIASFSATSTINVTGALCGTNPTAIDLTGNGTASPAGVSPGSLDFGLVNCGTIAAPKKIRVSNASGTAFTFTAALTTGTYYTLSPTGTINVAANSFTDLTVTPVMIPSTSAITPNLYGDTVTITTTAPADTPHAIALLMTAQGAILDQSTGAIDFGSVLVSAPATQTFTVSNKGNAPATVSYAAAPSVYTVSPQAQVVGGGANYTATLHFAPTAQQQYPGTAQMTVDASTVLCAAVKPAITLSGQGALDAQVAPTSLDFGLVNCGATGTAKKFTLTNTSKASFTWGATLGTAYYTISPTSGSLAKGASVMITVTPVKIPVASATTADLYADTVKITTTPVLESPYLVSLHETAQGAILSFNPTSINFGNVKTNKATSTRGFSVVNDGNLAAPVTLMESGSQFSISATSGTANAGASLPVNATFAPTVTGVSNGSVSVTTTAIKCAPLPANMTLTGNGL